MKKGDLITISGKTARIKSSTRRVRQELIEAKKAVLDKIGDLADAEEQDVYDKLGEYYKSISGFMLDFDGGLPDLAFFASDDFEDKYFREIELDFLSI